MKKYLKLLAISILFFQYFTFATEKNKKISCSPDIKGLRIEIVKQKINYKVNETIDFFINLIAIENLKEVEIKFKNTKGLQEFAENKKIKILKISSGETQTLPISTKILENSIQTLSITVKYKFENNILNTETTFKTGEEIVFLYDKNEDKFTFETSFESMTNEYRIWNVLSQDSLEKKGEKIKFKQIEPYKYFVKAEPAETKIKKEKA